MEKAFFFENEGFRLFGYLHDPESRTTGCDGKISYGMVLCPPFGDEHIPSYRILRNFAVQLCKEGIPVLRFDYRGYGDSEGEIEVATPETQVSDIRKAIEVLRNITGVKAVGLLGLRLGGTLALLASQLEPVTQFVILWAPILSPEVYFQGILRQQIFSVMVNREKRSTVKQLTSELKQGGKVDIGGFYLLGKVYNAFCGIDFLKLLQQVRQPVHIAVVGREVATMDKSVIDRLKNMCKNDVAAVVVHEEPFWRYGSNTSVPPPTRLMKETIDWLSAVSFHRIFS